eukprot:g3562.t1
MNSRQSLASTDDQRLSAFSLIEALRVARTYRFLLLFHYFNSRNEDDADFLTVEGGENTDAVGVVETGSFKTHDGSSSNAVADKSFKTNTKQRKKSRAASFKKRRRRSSSRRESSFIPNRKGKLIEKVKEIEKQPAILEEKPTIKHLNTEKHDGPEEIKVGEHSRGDDAGLSKNLWYSISDTIATNVISVTVTMLTILPFLSTGTAVAPLLEFDLGLQQIAVLASHLDLSNASSSLPLYENSTKDFQNEIEKYLDIITASDYELAYLEINQTVWIHKVEKINSLRVIESYNVSHPYVSATVNFKRMWQWRFGIIIIQKMFVFFVFFLMALGTTTILNELVVYPIERMILHLQRMVNTSISQILTKKSDMYDVETDHIANLLEKSDELLLNLLPQPVITALLNGRGILVEEQTDVTILFLDIVGFTFLSSQLDAVTVVVRLNKLYSIFDHLIEKYKCFKVETIGDAYLACSGCPTPDERHAYNITITGIAMTEAVDTLRKIMPVEFSQINIRVGIDSGPAIAGVIGANNPRYHLYGDTLKGAEKMESTGVPGKVQITERCNEVVEGQFQTVKRDMEKYPADQFKDPGQTTYFATGLIKWVKKTEEQVVTTVVSAWKSSESARNKFRGKVRKLIADDIAPNLESKPLTKEEEHKKQVQVKKRFHSLLQIREVQSSLNHSANIMRLVKEVNKGMDVKHRKQRKATHIAIGHEERELKVKIKSEQNVLALVKE